MGIRKYVSRNPAVLVSVSLLLILVVTYFVSPGVQSWVDEAYDVLTSDDEERIRVYVSQYGLWGPVTIIAAMALQMFLFVVPNILLIMIAITSYGPVWGSVISLLGICFASAIGYFIGKKLSPATLRKLISPGTQQKISEYVQDYGMLAIIVTRMTSFSNDGLSFVAGILGMRFRVYILATVTGVTPLIVTLAIFGRNGKIEKALIWIAAACLIMLIAYIFIDRRRKKLRNANRGE
ncbi:MAG TPA: VTT domain-containing protein [Chryseosolibacter sp.]|nr:VTT domain-containing protein [Chryseosolibacter sp.]